MSKNRLILSVIGGVFGLGVLVMLYLVWSSLSARTAAREGDSEAEVTGLEEVDSKARTLLRSKVYPSAASVKAIEANINAIDSWKKEALQLAARGDRVFQKTTPAAFKAFIVTDAKRLAALPGMVNGALVKQGFAFGPFKDYIAEGRMPSDTQLKELQRQWDDVATVTETLAAGGIAELIDVQFAKVVVEEEVQDQKQNKKAKKSNKKKAKGKEVEELKPSAQSYVFTFLARPAAFVKVVNALATSERFITVDSFTFAHDFDVIAGALGGEKKKAEGGAAPRGRRGRRAAAAAAAAEASQEEAGAKLKNGIVTDPVADAPAKVTMTVTVHDFRTLEESGKEEEEKK